MINKDNYMTVDEVANKLRVSRLTIYRWIYSGKLKTNRAGRKYLISEIEVKKLCKAD